MRRAGFVTVLAVAALGLGAPPTTRAAEHASSWHDASDLASSPDGRFLYGAGTPVVTFRRDAGTGDLTSLGSERVSGTAVAVSPDGRFAYVFGGARILVLARDSGSGRLTEVGTFGDDDTPISTARQLAVSRDGGQLYVLSSRESAITVLARDRASGALSVAQVAWGGPGGASALASPSSFALTGDDRHVYVANDDTTSNRGGTTGTAAVGVLARDAATGRLTSLGTAPRPGPVKGIAVSPDGRWVFGGVGDFAAWTRDAATGGLTAAYDNGPSRACTGDRCVDPTTMAVSPDGALVAITRPGAGAVDVWHVSADGATGPQVFAEGHDGVVGLGTPRRLVWSPDGHQLYVLGAAVPSAVNLGAPSTDGAVVTFGRDAGTDRLFYRATTTPGLVGVGGPGEPIPPSVTIDGGATYTNDPRVVLSVHWPYVPSLTLSNDPDLHPGDIVRAEGDDGQYRWRLGAGLSPDRSVRRVYVQGNDFYYPEGRIVSDDIILDQRSPEVVAGQLVAVPGATLAGTRASVARRRAPRVRLALRARDNRSKVRGLQVTASRRHPGRVRRFASRLTLTTASRVLFVRVRDGAGNWSRWRAIHRRALRHAR